MMASSINNLIATDSTLNTVGRDLIQHQNTYHITHVESSRSVAGSSHGQLAPPPTAFNDAPVDLLSAHFTGRQAEIELIARAFGRPRSNIPLRCVLFGDQGVGKSQLTYEWSKSTFARGENTYIIWMSATTIEKLDQGFSNILHLIDHPYQFHSEQSPRLIAARRWLEEVDSGHWLLVLDNVIPEVLGFLRDQLPRQNGRGSILFTTRTEDVAIALANVAGEQHEIVRVPMLSVQDGVELFLGPFRGGEIDVPSAKAEVIVKSVGCLPLAISHATSYMRQSRCTVDEMLALYQGRNKIHAISWKNTLSEYEHKSVAATFESQLEDLERNCPDASNLLKVLAYFDPENIPLDMLVAGATSAFKSLAPTPEKSASIVQKIKNKVLRRGDNKGKGRVDEGSTTLVVTPTQDSLLAIIQSPIELRNAIMELQTRCLTAYQDSSHSTLRIHDLIQLVVLEKTNYSATEQRQWFELAVELACNAFKEIGDYGSPACWSRCEELVPHIQSLTTRQAISSEAKAKLFDANSNFGWYQRSRGRYGEAEELLLRVLADEEQLLGVENLQTLATMYHLAVVYREQGRNDDAEMLLTRVLRFRKKLLGSEHARTLDTMFMLAYVYKLQGRYDESQELVEKVLKAREKQQGSEHIEALRTKQMLADIYSEQKRFDDAEVLYKQVLQSQEERLGPDHINIASVTNNLALLYLSQRRHSDAEELLKRVLQIWEKQVGSNHPDTLLAKCNLAHVYESQGRYDDAEELFVHVLERREEVLGPFHPHTRDTLDLLASTYEKMGRSDDAARIRRRADEPR